MTPYPLHHSTTGAAKAQLSAPLGGKPTVFLHVPVGAGRRLRLEIGVGQAHAVHEVLALVMADVERHFGPRPSRPDPVRRDSDQFDDEPPFGPPAGERR